MSKFLKPITIAIKEALSSFKSVLVNHRTFNGFLLSRGWLVEFQQSDMVSVQNAFNLLSNVEYVIDSVNRIERAGNSTEELIKDTLPYIKDIFSNIKDLAYVDTSSQTLFPLTEELFWTEIADDVFEGMLIDYLKAEQRTIYTILYLIGAIQSIRIIPTGINRIPYYKKNIDWNKIGELIANPTALLNTAYGWSSSGTNYDLLLNALENIFFTLGVNPRSGLISKSHFGSYFSNYTSTTAIRSIEIPFYESFDSEVNDYKKISISLMPAQSQATSNTLNGLLLGLNVDGFSSFEIPLSPEFLFKGESYFASSTYLGVAVYPNESPKLFTNAANTVNPIGSKISLVAAPVYPWILFGAVGTTRLMMNGIETSLEIKGSTTDPELVFRFGPGEIIKNPNVMFVFEPGEGDGFINKVLGKTSFNIAWRASLKWSSKTGIGFEGSGGFEIDIPLHKDKKPGDDGQKDKPSILRINAIHIAAKADPYTNEQFGLEIGLDIGVTFGFLDVVLTNVGAIASLKTKYSTQERGVLNNLDFDLGFKPPNGVGLQVNAKGVQGGGYVYFDKDKGRYMGALELNIMDKIHVTAVGIITTKAPDGSPGFSLLILASATFPGVPIGFGFTLNGVGAVGAANRRVEDNSLREGIRSGSIYNLMFPSNVVENINGIITDLEGIFPLQQNQYTFGAFFLLKWGVGIPLIDVKMGVILTLPNPVKITIIGTIRVALPKPEVPVLLLNVAFIGVIDLDNKYIAFDADIFDSRILMLTLSGSMVLRIFWGQRKDMLLSVGGFHPAYRAPGWLKLPQRMNRITISLFDQDNLRLTVATYFAVTSNTVQFGVALDFLFNVWKVSIVGRFGFDVLFQFNPFRFMAHVYAYLGVLFDGRELMSISLDFSLDGPGPWHAVGRAEFEVMKVRVSANFDKTWGEKPDTSVPEVEVRPMLVADLNKDENWLGTFPDKRRQLVKLNAGASETLLMDPVGDFTISQKALPLDVKVERYGGQKAKDADVYTISGIKISNQAVPVQKVQKVQENFAPAQFRDMDDKKKLEAAPFEYLSSGRKVMYDASDIELGDFMVMDIDYDCVIIDAQTRTFKAGEVLSTELVNNFILGGAIGSNAVSKQLRAAAVNPIAKVSMVQEGFQIKSKDSLKDAQSIKTGIKSSASSLTEALTEKERWESLFAGRFEVMPVY